MEPLLYSLVLAAGGSTRLGRPKQLLRLEDRTLIERAVDAAAAVTGRRAVLVLGAAWRECLKALGDSAPFVRLNGDWREGLGSSLAKGLAALPPRASGALIVLADQPLIGPAELALLASTWAAAPDRAVASGYAGNLGVPAVIPRRLFPELLDGNGEGGAQTVLRRERDALTIVECEQAAADVDTEGDVARMGLV